MCPKGRSPVAAQGRVLPYPHVAHRPRPLPVSAPCPLHVRLARCVCVWGGAAVPHSRTPWPPLKAASPPLPAACLLAAPTYPALTLSPTPNTHPTPIALLLRAPPPTCPPCPCFLATIAQHLRSERRRNIIRTLLAEALECFTPTKHLFGLF